MKRLFTAALVAALFVYGAFGLGTVTNDYSETRSAQVAGWYFTTTTNGAATGASKAISGEILRAWFTSPSGATNAFQVKLIDTYGSTVQLANNPGASFDGSLAWPTNGQPYAFDGPMTLSVTSTLQGPVWSGKLLIWYR